MTDQSKATIFLAEERGLDESVSFRSYQTFNFEKFYNEYKIPFGDLYVLNDDSLAGGYSSKMTVEENSHIIILPVVGTVDYNDSLGNTNTINAGELQVISLPGGATFEIANPYETELVNVLQFCIKTAIVNADPLPLLLGFNLEANRNSLVEVINGSSQGLRLNIGQFRGREEALYKTTDNGHRLFIFVIEGVFEVQGRLLHPRDGLALWDLDGSVDLEALSNEAIVFLVEIA